MTPEKKTANPRMYLTLVAKFLTEPVDPATLDHDCTQAAIGMADFNQRFAAWINSGCGESRIVEKSVPEPTVRVVGVTVDQTKTFEELKADGGYGKDRVNEHATEDNFPMGPIPEGKELVMFCLHREVKGRDKIVAERQKLGLEAVTSPAYLLSVGAQKSHSQLGLGPRASIVDIDANWFYTDDRIAYLCLWSDNAGRGIGPGWLDNEFNKDNWFLALRDISPQT